VTLRERAVEEIFAEKAELPQLVRHVLADIGDRPVGSYDDFLARLHGVAVGVWQRCSGIGRLWFGARLVLLDAHDPAALQASLGLHEHGAGRLEELERVRPEVQAQDVAFPRQEVVADVQPVHRFQVQPDDAVGDEGGKAGSVVIAVLDLVKRARANGQTGLVVVVPFGDARVEIPAVVVEPRRVGELADLVERLVLELAEADSDVSNLYARVVDVVLDLDLAAEKTQQPSERIPEGGVPEMADVRRLVRVDGGVLDDCLVVRAVGGRCGARRQPPPDLRFAIEEEVDVAVRRCLDARESGQRAEGADDFLRDGARSFSQAAGELEGERNREIPERAPRRHFDRNRREHGIIDRNVIQTPDGVAHVAADSLLNR
jgi:hypothetical protein